MANPQSFDQLNMNILKRRSEPYYKYFGDMLLTDKQKKNRERIALIIEEHLMLFFTLYDAGANVTTLKQELTYGLYDLLADEGYFKSDADLTNYIANTVNDLYQSTADNLFSHPNDYDYTGTTQYWLSKDRAMFIAENEANTAFNSKEFIEANEHGYTFKIWDPYPDNNVRPTHEDIRGVKIPIGEYFEVGAARMLFPKDLTSEFSTGAEHPEEVISCRCTIRYV